MAFSFLHLAVRALFGALVRSRRGLDAKDIELLSCSGTSWTSCAARLCGRGSAWLIGHCWLPRLFIWRAGVIAGSAAKLRKLGFIVSATSIRRLLSRTGFAPAPRRGGRSWREFLKSQAASIIACDLFTVETVFLRRFSVLFFVAHASRRVWLGGCTRNPTGEWVTQQARNLARDFSDQGFRFLIRDRDSKYSASTART
jgi:hypothetical protein